MASNGDKTVSLIDMEANFGNLPANSIGSDKLASCVENIKEGNFENLMMEWIQ